MYFDPIMYLTQVSLLAVWIFFVAGLYVLFDKFILKGNTLPEERLPEERQ